MTKKETEFSKYAQAFFEIIDEAKSRKALFVKDLLKIGLTDEDKDYLDDTFPSVTTSKGKKSIEKDKADQLRKYLRGDNDISDIVCQLETEFDEEFRERYCEELQDYDDARIMAFAQVLNIDVSEDDIDIVSEAIAEYYSSLIKRATTKKKTKSKASIDILEAEGNNIALSYILTKSEKDALIKLCDLLKRTVVDLRHQADRIDKMQFELKSLTESDEDKNWKPHLEYDIDSKIIRFDETYSRFENLRADLIELLTPKKNVDSSFDNFVSNNSDFIRKEYKITYPCSFNYKTIVLMLSEFNSNIDRIIRYTSKL